MKRFILRTFTGLCLALATLPASAAFHLWTFNEVYTNADGSIQFIELTTGFDFQQFVSAHALTVTSGVTTHTYNVTLDLPGSSTNKKFIFATAGFAAVSGVTPDYVVPNGFLFPGGGTLNWAGFDSWTYGALPTDGELSLNRSGVTGANSPTNFAGTTGHVSLLDPAGDADADGIPNGVEAGVGRNPNVKDNDVFTNARLFAMQQYRDFLGREGDAGGIQYYIDGINGGQIPRPQAIENFFLSPEFGGIVAPVTRLYFATFLRIPDYPGLIFQVNAFRAGTPLAVIANNFTLSPEFMAVYGSLNNAQYVTLLYQNVLGRAPVQAEIDFHVARLTSGATRGEVLVGFSESPEYKALEFNAVYVTNMYVGMLRRAPDAGGFDFWVAYMAGGNSGQALIAGFLQSPEYHNRFLP